MNEEQLTAAREYNWLKTKKCREQKKTAETIKITRKGFAMPQAYRKVIKLKIQWPKSPSKTVEAVMGQVNEFGLKLKESDFNRNRKEYGRLSNEVKSQVVDFYYRADVIYSVPGLKDEITVWTEQGKEKMRKYYLEMYLCEVYAMFKTVYPDICFTISQSHSCAQMGNGHHLFFCN